MGANLYAERFSKVRKKFIFAILVTASIECVFAFESPTFLPYGGQQVREEDGVSIMRAYSLPLLGTAKYGNGDKTLGPVNINAPKGGSIRFWSLGSFDCLNPYLLTGNAATG